MSFLDSIISSINDGKAGSPAPTPNITKRPALSRTATPNDAVLTKPPTTQSSVAVKRKAEDAGTSAAGPSKAQKLGINSSLAPSRSATSSPTPRSPAAIGKGAVPYRGTVKSQTQSPAPPGPSKLAARGTPAVAATPAPAKTGYLAILERAKAAQEAAKTMGQIKHHKTEKLSRRERERLQAEAASKSKPSSTKNSKPDGRPLKPGAESQKGVSSGKERKPVEVGYKGTMKSANPPQPAYRGTMGRAAPPSNVNSSSRDRYGSRDRYDEDEGELDEEEDYESDASSAMEAGWDDVAHEEMASALQAKREDEEALAEENEMKRQKLERKKKLQALQDAAAKKKKMY